MNYSYALQGEFQDNHVVVKKTDKKKSEHFMILEETDNSIIKESKSMLSWRCEARDGGRE